MRPDAERQLTERGRGQSRCAGAAFAAMGVEFAAILASPKARARETAELVLEQLPRVEPDLLELQPSLAGGIRSREALELLADVGADGPVLLVAHEPDLSGIVDELTGGRVDLKKGGLAVVRLGAGGAELVLLLRPAELALIA
jgi:phosphohistidine phosphatase